MGDPPDEEIRRSVKTWLIRVLLPARVPGQQIPGVNDLKEVEAMLEERVLMPSLSDRYRRWFEYEKESHAKVLASLESVPEPQRSSEAFQKAAGLLAHVVLARWLWLARLGVVPRERAPSKPEDFFPRDVSLADLRSSLGEMERAWESYLSGMDDAELSRVFEYQALDGSRFRNTIEDILTQLFGHSWYHRGQIAQLVRGLGAAPAVTDFVFWSREAL